MESSVESEAVTNLNMESSVGAKTVPEGTDGAVDNVPGESLETVNDVNTTSTDDNGASQFADGPNETRSYVNADSYASRAPERLVVILLISQPGGVLLIPRLMICRNAPERLYLRHHVPHQRDLSLKP